MATEYVIYHHTHCTISVPDGDPDDEWNKVFPIVLHTGGYVWVAGTYQYHRPWPEVRVVRDGRSDGYDCRGNCILSVPAEWCQYLTPQEAETLEDAEG